MAETGRKLVLGFIGGDQIHRDNAVALLDDLIATYHRNNKGAEVVLYLATDPFTHTMADLADYALTSGHKLGLVGTDVDLAAGSVKPFLAAAEGRLNRVTKGQSVPGVLVEVLNVYAREARLILIADPDEDDDVYNAVEAALEKQIKVRTLLGGLDEITIIDESSEEETLSVTAPAELGEPEEEEEYQDLEDLNDISDPYLSEDDGVQDSDGDIVDAELVGSGGDDAPDNSDRAGPEEAPAEQSAEEKPVAETTETKPTTKKATKATKTVKKTVGTKATDTQLNGESLLALAESDRPAFYEIAAEYGISPGRGIKVLHMVNRILEITGGTVLPQPKRASPKRAAAAAAPGPEAAGSTPAPKAAKRVAPAKKAPAPAKAVAAKAAKAATAAAPNSRAVRAAVLLVEAALKLLSE